MIRVTNQVYFSPQPLPHIIQRPVARSFTHIVNVSDRNTGYPFFSHTAQKIHIAMSDEGDCLQAALKAAEYVHTESKDQKAKILVHCTQGVNRAPFVILTYLCLYDEYDVEKALAFLKTLKSSISINPPWIKQLKEYIESTAKLASSIETIHIQTTTMEEKQQQPAAQETTPEEQQHQPSATTQEQQQQIQSEEQLDRERLNKLFT